MLHAGRWFTKQIEQEESLSAAEGSESKALSLHNAGDAALEFFDGEIGVGVNADFAGDAHRFHGQVFGGQFGMLQHGARGGDGVTPAGADSHDSVVGFNDVAVAGQDESGFAVGHDEHGFEMTQSAVFAPILGKLDGGLLQIAGRFLELALKALEQRNGVGGGTCEPGQHLVVVQAASLARSVLHHVIAHGDLAIGDKHHFAVSAQAQDRGAMNRRAILMILHPSIIPPATLSAKSEVADAVSKLEVEQNRQSTKKRKGRLISRPAIPKV